MSAADRRPLGVWLPVALLVAGSVVFVGAGAQHPRIDAALGPLGSDEFYRSFAAQVRAVHGWQTMHAFILAGPVLWALGVSAAAPLLPARSRVLVEGARGALLLGAALWAVAFVLDGWVTPRHAGAVAAAGIDRDRAALTAFGVHQYTMARLGVISVVLMAAATLAVSVALLAEWRERRWLLVVGTIGLLTGGWPLAAASRGEFDPGPFTSPYWSETALSLAVWYLALGAALAGFARAASASDLPPAAGRHMVEPSRRSLPSHGVER